MGITSSILGGLGAAGGAAGAGTGMLGLLGQAGLDYAVGSSILGGVSSLADGKAQEKALKAGAAAARGQAANQAAKEREKGQKLAAAQRVKLGASGVDVNQGSALNAQAEHEAESEVNALEMLYSGEAEAARLKRQAGQAKRQGVQGLLGGISGGLGMGLAGVGRLAGSKGGGLLSGGRR